MSTSVYNPWQSVFNKIRREVEGFSNTVYDMGPKNATLSIEMLAKDTKENQKSPSLHSNARLLLSIGKYTSTYHQEIHLVLLAKSSFK